MTAQYPAAPETETETLPAAEGAVLAILRRHSIGAFNGSQSACSRCRKWMTHEEYREHLAALIAQRPAAPETRGRPNGLTEAERETLADAFVAANRAEFMDTDFDVPILRAVERIVAERVRVIEGERDAAERSKAALVAKVKRLQDQIARASMGPGQDRQKAMHAYAARAESAEAAHEAEKAAHERLRAGVEALEDEWKREPDDRAYCGDHARRLRSLLGGGEAR